MLIRVLRFIIRDLEKHGIIAAAVLGLDLIQQVDLADTTESHTMRRNRNRLILEHRKFCIEWKV